MLTGAVVVLIVLLVLVVLLVTVVVMVDAIQESQVKDGETIHSGIHEMKLLISQTWLWQIIPITVPEMLVTLQLTWI